MPSDFLLYICDNLWKQLVLCLSLLGYMFESACPLNLNLTSAAAAEFFGSPDFPVPSSAAWLKRWKLFLESWKQSKPVLLDGEIKALALGQEQSLGHNQAVEKNGKTQKLKSKTSQKWHKVVYPQNNGSVKSCAHPVDLVQSETSIRLGPDGPERNLTVRRRVTNEHVVQREVMTDGIL